MRTWPDFAWLLDGEPRDAGLSVSHQLCCEPSIGQALLLDLSLRKGQLSSTLSGASKPPENLMENLFFAADGSASALASVQQFGLGFLGVVRFDVGTRSRTAIRHECLHHRDTRLEALEDARADARKLVRLWVEDRVRLGGG
jgi:hypothetical protein